MSEKNLTYADVNLSTNKFADIVGKLEKANINTAQAVALFGQEAGPGMMALVNQGSSALLKIQEEITNTSAASDMAKRQVETFQGSMKLLKSQGEEVAITIGNVLIPVLSKFLGKITPLIDKFNNLSDSGKELAVKIALVAAAAGPVFLVLSKVMSLFG